MGKGSRRSEGLRQYLLGGAFLPGASIEECPGGAEVLPGKMGHSPAGRPRALVNDARGFACSEFRIPSEAFRRFPDAMNSASSPFLDTCGGYLSEL